jgi:hypothetical protein
MREVDYDDNDMEVVVVVEDGSRYVIECTGDEEQRYQRYLYNFLMDIKEKAEEGFAEVIDK